jgi:hypothetical protein
MARKKDGKGHGSDNTPAPPAEEEYRVGPGRPPKQYQWKPGVSGNPKGAKRKKQSLIPELKKEFERVFSQKLKVTQGDRQRFITRWVAGLEQLSIQFAKGDRHARRDVFYFAERLGIDLLNSTPRDETVYADHQATSMRMWSGEYKKRPSVRPRLSLRRPSCSMTRQTRATKLNRRK